MGTLVAPRPRAPSYDGELSDPAFTHLFGPSLAPVAPSPQWSWALPRKLLAEDETLVLLEDGGLFQIREVPDGADFEIFVDEEDFDPLGIGSREPMNLHDFRAEFEADLAVFEGIRAAN
jgi:hypothetical protein